MAKPKYLNAFRRELVLWVCSLQVILESNQEHFKGKELGWLNSIILSIEALCKLMLSGIDQTELKTIENAIKAIEPRLYTDKLVNSQEPAIKVSKDLIYDLAESAVDLCKYDCSKDFANCPRRKLFSDLLIAPWTTDGPCQYYRREDET